jgi:Mg2+-importing ATPase
VFLVNALLRRDFLESFLFSVALAVGLTPELLPMIVSVTLSSGAVRMAEKKVIVKQLASIENFGSMDILCSDKTGTLTHGEITVDCHLNLRGDDDETVIRLAALNSVYQTGLRSPMDEAILRHEHPAVAQYRRVDEIPFDFQRRRVSVIVQDGARRLLITKGAPESVLPVCTAVETAGVAAPLDAEALTVAEALFHRLSADGYRALAVAYRVVGEETGYGVTDERDLVFVGFAAFLDPPYGGGRGHPAGTPGRRDRGEDHHRGQRAGDPEDLPGGRSRRGRDRPRGRGGAHVGSGPRRGGGADPRVRPRLSDPEEPHRAGTPRPGARGGLRG